jgi:hypothetical protein
MLHRMHLLAGELEGDGVVVLERERRREVPILADARRPDLLGLVVRIREEPALLVDRRRPTDR